MQRCDSPARSTSSARTRGSLNPTYPGCSAVIPLRVRRALLARGGSLNPTYPGCSAVIDEKILHQRRYRL